MGAARGRCGAKKKRIMGSGEGKRLHGRPRRRRLDNIQRDRKGTRRGERRLDYWLRIGM